LWLSGVLVLALATGALRAEEKKDDPKKAEAKATPAEDNASDIDIPIPLREKIKGIKIPHHGPDGKLLMVFDIGTALKTDDTHIALEVLKIDAYSEDGRKIYIELPTAVFNLENRILYGDNNVLVKRDDFEITGKQGEFNTKTRFSKVTGNVKMIIYDIDEEEMGTSASPSPSPAASPQP